MRSCWLEAMGAGCARVSTDATMVKYKTMGQRIPGLDAIRALAILLVVAWHWQGLIGDYVLHGGFGPFGVTIFFVLSGYLITSLLLREYRKTGTISLGKFYRNRALRLFPVFYICWGINSALIIFHRVH